MGTRNSTLVKLGEEIKVAQYGQWDGYPTGVGQEIADFLKTVDLEDFKKKVAKVEAFTDKEVEDIIAGNYEMFVGASREWTKDFPQLSRDTGAGILQMIADGTVKKVQLDEEFKNDGLFCEYWYELDLDNEIITMNNQKFTFAQWATPGFMDYLEFDTNDPIEEYLKSDAFTKLDQESKKVIAEQIKKEQTVKGLDKYLEVPEPNTVIVTINTDNQAFQDGNCGEEVSRILRNLATSFELEEEVNGKPLKDANGNTVGEVKYVSDDTNTTR